ncbi:MAG: hypothetical protein V1772_10045 [Chloroflexota bacterium]
MFAVLLGLTILCVLLTIAGASWMLMARGRARPRTHDEVAGDMLSALGGDEAGEPLAQTFRGVTVGVHVETELSYAEIKALIAQRRWREAAGPLMAMVGVLGLVLFGSLAFYVRLDDKLVGGLIAAVCVFTVARIVLAIARA